MSRPELPRRPPAAPVAVHPVPEYLADTALAARYEEMKAAFRVPWMGVVAMAHAHYRHFYDCLWAGLRPIAESTLFQAACRDLRAETEAAAARLQPGDLTSSLQALGYAPRELAEIRAVIEVFSHGNYPYLLLATVSRHLLAGGALAGRQSLVAATEAAAVPARPLLMEEHHADPATRALYRRIERRLGLPFVNTDYRALARWPSYFQAAWWGLEPLLRAPAHAAAAAALHEAALAVVRGLPNPAGLSAAALRDAAEADAGIAEVAAMVELFQWLLPELCVNVACFRRQLSGA